MKIDFQSDELRCGNLTIYPKLGQVKAASATIRLGPVNMRVLMTLIENQGRVVSRAELFDSVWKNQVVSDDTLTRCISDLRAQLGKHSGQAKLIKTLPKRGYQWIPEVRLISEELPLSKDHKHYLYWLIVAVVSLMILSTSALWIANQFLRPDQIRIALLPIQTGQPSQQIIAINIEDVLRSQILKTHKLRFLSSSVFANKPENPFQYLSREFGAQWVVEGKIRQYQDKIRVSLSLVDVRTALVVHTTTKDVDKQNPMYDDVCQLFIVELLHRL